MRVQTLVLILVVVLTGCGKGSNNPLIPGGGSGGGGGYAPTTHYQTLQGTRIGNGGIDTPGNLTASQSMIVTLPALSDFTVLSNAAEGYHVTLNVGIVSCDYIHIAGSGVLSNGSGCTTGNPTVSITPGQQITIDIQNNGQVNTSAVSVNLSLTY